MSIKKMLQIAGYKLDDNDKISGRCVEGAIVCDYIYVDTKGSFDNLSNSKIALPIPKSIRGFIYLYEKMQELTTLC